MKTTTILGYSAIAVAFVAVASSLLSSTNAFAFDFSNSASQLLQQSQSATQSSSITSGQNTLNSGNNIAILSQNNTGNLALGQAFQ